LNFQNIKLLCFLTAGSLEYWLQRLAMKSTDLIRILCQFTHEPSICFDYNLTISHT